MSSCFLRSSGTDKWVIAAGALASVSVPPRLTARLRDLQRVEEGERLLLAALQIEREGRSGAGAMAACRCPPGASLPRGSRDSRPSRPSGWSRRKSQTLAAFSPARLMRSSSVSRLRSSIQAVLGSQIVPIVLRIMRTWLISPFSPTSAAGDEVAVPAGIFGQAVDAEVGALRERLGPQRPEEGVVDRDRRALVVAEGGIARGGDRLDVDQHVGRVGRAFEIDQR